MCAFDIIINTGEIRSYSKGPHVAQIPRYYYNKTSSKWNSGYNN